MKLILGVIIVLIGLWFLIPADMISSIKTAEVSGFDMDWLNEFVTVLKGFIPPFLILVGALVVWIESEELKSPEVPEIEKEVETKKKTKKSKKKKE